MRILLSVLLVVGLVSVAGARRPSPRCCLVIPVPEVPARESCVYLRVKGRRIPARRACRLLGGRPIGRGVCASGECDRP
jgi:hypothetical protein